MAGSYIKNVQSVISVATTAGLLTLTSTGMYVSMVGWISNGTTSQKVRITGVPDGTHVTAQKMIDSEGTEATSGSGLGLDNRLKAPSYAKGSDLSAYTGGTYSLIL